MNTLPNYLASALARRSPGFKFFMQILNILRDEEDSKEHKDHAQAPGYRANQFD